MATDYEYIAGTKVLRVAFAAKLPGFISIKNIMNTIQILKSKAKFLLWKARNPSKSFHDYYVVTVNNRISKNQQHATLGKDRKDAERFSKTAEIEFNFLKRQGLNSQSIFVDYGCGSVRLGHVLIPYLDPAHYHGIDMTDDFFKLGLEQIDENLILEKKPHCAIISDDEITRLSKKNVDYIFSSAVLYHVPENEMTTYFSNIIRLMNETTKAYIDFTDAPEKKQISSMTWHYPSEFLVQILKKFDVDVELIKFDQEQDAQHYPETHTIIQLTKNISAE